MFTLNDLNVISKNAVAKQKAKRVIERNPGLALGSDSREQREQLEKTVAETVKTRIEQFETAHLPY